MNKETWLKEVKAEEIPEVYQDLVYAIGVEALLNLSFAIGGTTIYVPKPEHFIQNTKSRLIISEFNGGNLKELAIKYSVSDSYIRKLINQHLLEKSQLKLF